MIYTETIVIGAGQAGLAMSRCLSERTRQHVVLERGRIGERWRSERWDSLRLLTPNWQTRLPGMVYDGSDPDGFMTAGELRAWLARYAASFAAPVREGAAVHEVREGGRGFVVQTSAGVWTAPAVVIATGHSDTPSVPALAADLSPAIAQVVPSDYRRAADLPRGGVLVVGASATGVQLADEIHASGRPVTLAVGRHTRLPRRYRGHDILWWLDRMGLLAQRAADVHDLRLSRGQPSLQLVGRPDHASLDLATLQDRGVCVTGRLIGAAHDHLAFDDDLVATTAAADIKLAELRQRIDRFIAQEAVEAGPVEPFVPIWPRFTEAPTRLDLTACGIASVVWATGFRRDYSWLRVPVLDGRGELRHDAGVTSVPGLFVLGLNFMRRRNSSFIGGAGEDARELAPLICAHLDRSLTPVGGRQHGQAISVTL
ncbi:MAG TPA: NAD(P)-binding domain-containing protein [Vicinamibacterales bacterium]|nr:NAD(P)-binding domain-containing protein [Vicinamibacterales bacterium]